MIATTNRQQTICEVCGAGRGRDGCTNGRCQGCHTRHCTHGGSRTPGHGRGTVATPYAPAEAAHVHLWSASSPGARVRCMICAVPK